MIESENAKNEDEHEVGDDCTIMSRNDAREKEELLRFSSNDDALIPE